MLLKLLIIGALLYAIYRFFGGRILADKRDSIDSNDNSQDSETLVECSECSTYVVKKDAIYYKGKWYCSKECLSKA